MGSLGVKKYHSGNSEDFRGFVLGPGTKAIYIFFIPHKIFLLFYYIALSTQFQQPATCINLKKLKEF